MKTDLYRKWLEVVKEKSGVKSEWLKPQSFKDGDPYKHLTSSIKEQFHIYAVHLWQSEVGAEFWFKHRQHSRKWPLQSIQETLNQDNQKETKGRWLADTKARFSNYHTHQMCQNIANVLRKAFPDIMHNGYQISYQLV